jgi:hypothetical protein
MDKESLELIKDRLNILVDIKEIPIQDKVELLINLMHFLEDYEDNIKVLEKHRILKEVR